jgi:hypothetical protein
MGCSHKNQDFHGISLRIIAYQKPRVFNLGGKQPTQQGFISGLHNRCTIPSAGNSTKLPQLPYPAFNHCILWQGEACQFFPDASMICHTPPSANQSR